MKRCTLIFFIIFMMLNTMPCYGQEMIGEFFYEQQLEYLELDEIQSMLLQMDKEFSTYTTQVSLSTFLSDMLHGEMNLSIIAIGQGILGMFQQEILLNTSIIGKMLFLAVVYSVLQQLNGAFLGGSIHKISNIVMLFIAIVFVMESITVILSLGQETVEAMANFMQLLVPIQMILLVAVGNISSMSFMQPTLLLVVNVITHFFSYLVFPLIYFEVTIKIVNNLTSDQRLKHMASLFRQGILAIISFTSAGFLAVLSMQGIGGAVIDGVSLRTAKYMASTTVPVVGGMISNLLETAVNGALLIKNAIGILGLLVILFITLLPVIKIFTVYLLYRFSAAIIQPLGDSKIVNLMQDVSTSFLLVFAAVTIVAVMFFFMIVIIIATANFAISIR